MAWQGQSLGITVTSAVPEPATGALWALGLACGGLALRRRRAAGADQADEQAAALPAREAIASSA